MNLLGLMHTSRQSGDIIVEPHEQEKMSWQGYFRLIDGQIAACHVQSKIDGQLTLQGDDAIQWLANPVRGKLAWALTESTHSSGDLLPLHPTQSRPTKSQELHKEQIANRHPPSQNNENISKELLALQANTYTQITFPVAPSIVPYRTERGMQTPGNILSSRDHRQVFSLIDGNRNIAEIVRLLHKSPGFIVIVLNELKDLGLIE